MKVLAITQARTGSTRLPRKVLKEIAGKTLLEIHLQRILHSKLIDKLVVATTIEKEDDEIVKVAERANVTHYRGSLENVLDRFYQAAKIYQPEWVVRLTSDCPLIDANLIDQVIVFAMNQDVDYCSNTLVPTFPDGIDIEVFKFQTLEKAWREATLPSDREHVTSFIYRNSAGKGSALFTSVSYEGKNDFSETRLTVDEPADFEVITRLITALGTEAGWQEYTDYYRTHSLHELNKQHVRNEGYLKSLKNDNDQQL